MTWLWWVGAVCFVICGIAWWTKYKKEKEKNPHTTTITSVLSKSEHQYLENDCKTLYENANELYIKMKFLIDDQGKGVRDIDILNASMEFYDYRDKFDVIYKTIEISGSYKDKAISKNDYRLFNEYCEKMNTLTNNVDKLMSKITPF